MDFQNINGKILHKDKALIPLSDLGLLRGYSVFDFFRVLEGIPIFLEDHIERLLHSAEMIDIDPAWTPDEITRMCYELIAANETSEAGMRIVVTGGYSADGYTPGEPNIYITLHKLPTYNPDDYINGRAIIVSNFTRDMPEVKTTVYAHALRQRKRMKEHNAVEVLYHSNGDITECSRSNIFFADDNNVIHTPNAGMLRGITRKQVISIARSKYEVRERKVDMSEIPDMRECFLTSSTKGVLPIVRVDDEVIGDGRPGTVTMELHEAFKDHVQQYIAARR